MKLLLGGFLLSFFACSHSPQKEQAKKAPVNQNAPITYELNDMSGKFRIVREAGKQKGNNYYVKATYLPEDGDVSKVIEKSTVISHLGSIKRNDRSFPFLRPELAHHVVYLEGKKFESQMKLNTEKKSLEVYFGGEGEKYERKELKFPSGRNFCFFSQLIECLKVSQVLQQVGRQKSGTQGLVIIWDGYPYFNQQYPVLPEEVFTSVKFAYDGEDEEGGARYRLEIGEEVILYHLDSDYNFLKMFWVSQGLTQTPWEK